ncbi:MAG: dihydroneopterin aldolase, partial [Ferruginibacter sp.]
MFTIQLNKMFFYAYHGVHKEETIVGTNFEVSVSISFDANKRVEKLSDTINYVSVYEIVKLKFATPEKLLETLAQNIAAAI